MSPFVKIWESDKSISYWPGWSEPEPETSYVRFDAPLDIAGVTQTGVYLHGGAYRDRPDECVSFELAIRNVRGRRRIPMARLDWRRGGHTNPRGQGPRHLQGLRLGDVHMHCFTLNWIDDEQRMRKGNVPVAMEITQELQSFEDVRMEAGKRLRINNIDIVFPPNWEYDLFK